MTTLSYYFNSQNTFQYNLTIPFLSSIGNNNSNAAPISLPDNDSSIPVMSLQLDGVLPHYFSLNQIFISLTSLYNGTRIKDSMYQLILQGNLNDYTTNSNNQIIIILPIFTNIAGTIEGVENSITNLNSTYLNAIFNNMILDTRQVYYDGVDFNQFLSGVGKGLYYSNIIDSNTSIPSSNPATVYTIIQYDKSNLYQNINIPSWIKFTTAPIMPEYDSQEIITINNGKPITTITEQDIYIDCSPTNNLGQPVDIYTSKNLDQLKMFEINDLKVWAFRIITIFVIILIVFVIIKLFQVDGSNVPPPPP